jgi:hypothetical protein
VRNTDADAIGGSNLSPVLVDAIGRGWRAVNQSGKSFEESPNGSRVEIAIAGVCTQRLRYRHRQSLHSTLG